MEVLEIVLSGTANPDEFRRHSGQKCRTYQSSTPVLFLQKNCVPEECLPLESVVRVTKMKSWLLTPCYKHDETFRNAVQACRIIRSLASRPKMSPTQTTRYIHRRDAAWNVRQLD